MSLVHEFEEFIDNSFQEFPVRLKEPRVLTNNIHNIRCNDSLVIFAPLDLTKTKEVLDDSDQKALFLFLIW